LPHQPRLGGADSSDPVLEITGTDGEGAEDGDDVPAAAKDAGSRI